MTRIILILTLISILISIFFLAMKKTEEKSIILVFINKKTKKYHQEKCPYSKNLDYMTLEEATKSGYTLCDICNEEDK